MPINNELLKNVSNRPMCSKTYSLTVGYLLKLPGFVTNVLSEEEEMELDKEIHVHHFNSGPTVPQYDSDMRIDH